MWYMYMSVLVDIYIYACTRECKLFLWKIRGGKKKNKWGGGDRNARRGLPHDDGNANKANMPPMTGRALKLAPV